MVKSSGPFTLMKLEPHSLAMALASNVLPQLVLHHRRRKREK
jgi:hypothetical protein